MSRYTKDPDARLDYTWDWSKWLAESETIVSAVVTVPSGITLDLTTNDVSSVTAWILGGEVGKSYTVGCKITTSATRVDERSITIVCKHL